MDLYPEDYAVHNYPFIVLLGLSTESNDDIEDPSLSRYPFHDEKGIEIHAEAASISGAVADELVHEFFRRDARVKSGSSSSSKDGADERLFRIQLAGRVGQASL